MNQTIDLDLRMESHQRQCAQLCRSIMDSAMAKIHTLGYGVRVKPGGNGSRFLTSARMWFEIDQKRYDLGAVKPRNPGAASGAITASIE